jgi:hypothetical protein
MFSASSRCFYTCNPRELYCALSCSCCESHTPRILTSLLHARLAAEKSMGLPIARRYLGTEFEVPHHEPHTDSSTDLALTPKRCAKNESTVFRFLCAIIKHCSHNGNARLSPREPVRSVFPATPSDLISLNHQASPSRLRFGADPSHMHNSQHHIRQTLRRSFVCANHTP